MTRMWLKVSNGTRYPGLILGTRDRLPENWGSLATFRWILANVTDGQRADIRKRRILLADSAWTTEQLAQFEKNRQIYEQFRADVEADTARRIAQYPKFDPAYHSHNAMKALEQVGQIRWTDEQGGLVNADVVVDIVPHILPAPPELWKEDPSGAVDENDLKEVMPK